MMSQEALGFHVAATLRAGNLSEAIETLDEACRAAVGAPTLVDWRHADDLVHDSARAVPRDLLRVELTFADFASGTLQAADDGTFSFDGQHVLVGLDEEAQRAALRGWADVFRALGRTGALLSARVDRERIEAVRFDR